MPAGTAPTLIAIDHDDYHAKHVGHTADGRLRDLGAVTFDRIQVRPFAVNRFGTTFGLLVSEPEDDDESWWVELHPGNYMAFSEPWDSGVYDT